MVAYPGNTCVRRLFGWLAGFTLLLPPPGQAQEPGGQIPQATRSTASTSPLAPAAGVGRFLLMTVTDTTAAFTWETSRPGETIIRYGTQKDHLDRTARPATFDAGGQPVGEPAPSSPRRFQFCELRSLRPGTRYSYACQVGDAATGNQAAGQLTTLAPPPGEELFSFATMTDTHIGQQVVARLSLGGKVISEGVRWPEPNRPFWRLAVEAAIDEINARGVAFTVIKGDLADGSNDREMPQAKRLFDRLKRPYHVVHGNHDAPAPFLRTFNLTRSWYSFDEKGMHFVVLDTEPLVNEGNPALDLELKWLAEDLRQHAGQWTFVFLHRPILPRLERPSGEPLSEELLQWGSGLLGRIYGSGASRTIDVATGKSPSVSPKSAQRLAALLRGHGRVAGVFAGHLHRNYVGYWPQETGNLPYVETASTKEYPCGYAITRVFAGGYLQSYHTPRDPQCLQWSAMTQDAYTRLGLLSKAGGLAERNFVVRFDELHLSPKASPESKPATAGSEKQSRQP